MQNPRTRHHTLLVVDDDAAFRSLLTRALAGDDLDVVEARNGVEALDYVLVSQTQGKAPARGPDLVLSDIHMPGLRGLDLARQLGRACRATPVIFMTAFPEDSLREHALQLGARAFFDKPFDIDALRAEIERQLHGTAS